MFNPLSLFRQAFSPTMLGVDIGTTSIKIAEVERSGSGSRLVNYAFLESQSSLSRANTAFQTSNLKLFDEQITELLALTLRRMGPKTKLAHASIPGFASFTTVLKFPPMSNEELTKAIEFQARQYVPLPLSEVLLDWQRVGSFVDERGATVNQVLLISVPREQVKKYQKMFRDAGLSLVVIEIESLSLARSIAGNDPTPTCIVDIGSRSTAIVIVEGGQLKFTGQSDFAGASLTQALASSLNINPVRAEELKRERGIIGTGPNYELSTIMLPFLDVIISEVKRAQANYETQFPQAQKIERIVLSGGGANLLGIEKYVSKETNLPAVRATPFVRCAYPSALEPLVHELNPLMSVSLGLTLRES